MTSRTSRARRNLHKPDKMGEQFAASEPFTIKDEPIENLRPLKVIVIGAGFSGIYTTIRFVDVTPIGHVDH